MEEIRFLSLGDCAFTVELSKEMSEEVNGRIRFLCEELSKGKLRGIRECVPAFCSLTVYFDPLSLSRRKAEKEILKILASYKEGSKRRKRVFLIPVCYEGEYAPDMKDVSELTGLSKEEIVDIHTKTDYLIYMLGFLPGFPYLGGMDGRIEAKRLDSPRTTIPEGAVGIGGKQTGIYPLASPGGWRLIGRTPLKVYDSERTPPILYKAGDYIRFYSISEEEFLKIKAMDDFRAEVREEEV